MAAKVKIEKGMQASRPILAQVSKVVSTLPKTSYVVYFRNHMHEEEEVYKNIEQLKELFLPKHQLHLKIIHFEKGEQPVIVSNSKFQCENSKLLIEFKYLDYIVVISGTVLNQSQSNDGVVNLSVGDKKSYDDFYKFRKKYKTLENITKKVDFQIDHRIKLLIGGKEHQFNLEDKKREHYFLNLQSFAQGVLVVLQETTSVENFVQVEKIEQVDVDMAALTEGDFSYRAIIQFSNKFEVTFTFDLIKNQNLSTADFVAIRVLQSSIKASAIKIGTEQTIHLAECLKVHPLVGSTFFDYEWGYLNENIGKIQGSSSYEYLQKLTKSVPKYAHFANQEMIDLKSSNFIIFSIDGATIRVPNIYILKGFNYVENQKFSIKFFVDSNRLESKPVQGGKRNCKRIYQMSIQEIWNMNKLNKILDKTNSNNFILKIVNEDTYYYIPFVRKMVNRTQFRKEGKELVMRNQVTQLNGTKYQSLQNTNKNKEQFTLIESTSIHPFYLIKITSSSPLSVQLIVDNAIALEGSLSKDKIQSHAGTQLIHLLTSLDGNSKIGFLLNFTEISQSTDSAATYYNFKHQLSLAQPGESGEVTYDVEVQFEKESNIKSLRSKISPVSKGQASEVIVLREFSGSSGAYRKEDSLNFTLKIKKMYFNQEINYFDNEALLTKTITINPTAELLKEGKNVMVRLEKECYESLEFDIYDSNVKKRMKYFLQIYAQKNPFLDYKDSSYRFRMPPLLWNFNHYSQTEVASFEICTHLNRKNKNIDKFTFTQNFSQEITLDHYNYKDGLSIVESGKMAYSKFLKAIKLKCDILKDKIGWNDQSEWYFGVLCFPSSNFYFLAKRMFDPFEDKRKSQSGDSHRTVSRERSNRSDKHKIDPLAKTISNLDLFKLKQKKNQLIAEGRQLAARYVKRQEKIVKLTKKLAEIDEAIQKKEQEEKQIKVDRKKVKKQNVKMREFYRSICECGALNPQFNGYCDVCLNKLKQSYEIYMKQYKEKCYEYEKIVFDKFNKKEKIQKIKRKIAHMKSQNVVEEEEGGSPHLLIKDLEEKSLKKSIEGLEMQIFQLQEEKNSLVATSNWQMSVLQEKIAKQDQTIYKSSQQYDSLKKKLAELTKTIRTFNSHKE